MLEPEAVMVVDEREPLAHICEALSRACSGHSTFQDVQPLVASFQVDVSDNLPHHLQRLREVTALLRLAWLTLPVEGGTTACTGTDDRAESSLTGALVSPPARAELDRLLAEPALTLPLALRAWLVTPTALEATSPLAQPAKFPQLEWSCHAVSSEAARRWVKTLPAVQVGPDLEPKLRLVQLSEPPSEQPSEPLSEQPSEPLSEPPSEQPSEQEQHKQKCSSEQSEFAAHALELVPPHAVRAIVGGSTWTEARTYHRGLEWVAHRPEHLPQRQAWLLQLLRGQQQQPDILAVHVSVVSADQQLLLVERALNLSYYPGHWSASLEEQVSHGDLSAGASPMEAAALRGLEEELGIVATDVQTQQFLGFFLDLAYLSVGGMVLLELKLNREALTQRWTAASTPVEQGPAELNHPSERRAVAWMPLEPAVLAAAGEGRGPLEGKKLHPTACLRIKALWRLLQARAKPSAQLQPSVGA